MKLLFIEDDKLQLMKLDKAISKLGREHDFLVLDNAIDAKDIIASGNYIPDIMIVDLHMPEMDGISFIKAMKSSDCSHIPIIVLSTSTNKWDIAKCYRYGAIGYVLKPSGYPQYFEAVQSLILYWEKNLFLQFNDKNILEI